MKTLCDTLTPYTSKRLEVCTDGQKFYVKLGGKTSAARTFNDEESARVCYRDLYKNDK